MIDHIAKGSTICHQQGVTACTDMALGLGESDSQIETLWHAYQAAEQAQKLRVRTTCYVRINGYHTVVPMDAPTPFLTMSGVKLFSGIHSRTYGQS